jgi:multidrug efflux pump subunit AcrA (membrane-fusion protein)
MASRQQNLAVSAGVLSAAALALMAYSWFWWRPPTNMLVVSGNIEAYESVLSFKTKTIQSHIVYLPFDEGQWVQAGTLSPRMATNGGTRSADVRPAGRERSAIPQIYRLVTPHKLGLEATLPEGEREFDIRSQRSRDTTAEVFVPGHGSAGSSSGR